MTRDQVFNIIRWLYKHLAHVTIENEEQLPKEGPCIVTLNHNSRIDFPALIKLERYADVYAVAADKYKNFPIFGKMINDADMIWIDRTKADFAAMKRALNVLKEGKLLVLAPEGTRSRNGQMLQAKEGVVLMASKSHAPVISLSVTGTEAFMKDFLHFRKPNITLRFGPVYELPPIDPDNRNESLRAAADEAMCHIAAMLPERYRGFYKDYPRVKELQEEWKARGDLSMPD